MTHKAKATAAMPQAAPIPLLSPYSAGQLNERAWR
jgi:hypothetical protein